MYRSRTIYCDKQIVPYESQTSIPCSDENAFLLMLDMIINFGV